MSAFHTTSSVNVYNEVQRSYSMLGLPLSGPDFPPLPPVPVPTYSCQLAPAWILPWKPLLSLMNEIKEVGCFVRMLIWDEGN